MPKHIATATMEGTTKRIQNQRMPKHIATATMEGTTKRRWYKRQRDEDEGDFNIMWI